MPPLLHRIAYFKARVCCPLLTVRERFIPLFSKFTTAFLLQLFGISSIKLVSLFQVKRLSITRGEA